LEPHLPAMLPPSIATNPMDRRCGMSLIKALTFTTLLAVSTIATLVAVSTILGIPIG